MTKDAVAGRIRRLLSMADRKAKQDGIPDTESAVTPDLLDDALKRAASQEVFWGCRVLPVARQGVEHRDTLRVKKSSRGRGILVEVLNRGS